MNNITTDSVIKKAGNHVEADIDNELALMHIESGKFFSLSGTGRRIWELIGDGQTVRGLTEAMAQEYTVSKDVCEPEIIELLDKLQARTLVEVAKEAAKRV